MIHAISFLIVSLVFYFIGYKAGKNKLEDIAKLPVGLMPSAWPAPSKIFRYREKPLQEYKAEKQIEQLDHAAQ